jgi:hypothetical protein
MRLAFRDLTPRIANVAGLTAYQQVRLSIQKIGDPVAKQRMLFQDQDSDFCDSASWNAHANWVGFRNVRSGRSKGRILLSWGEHNDCCYQYPCQVSENVP